MQVSSMRVVRPLLEWPYAAWLVAALLLCESFLTVLIVTRVPYTKIDWEAYMQEVEGPIERRELDYAELRGETGPLVYPAGFVYIYGALRLLYKPDDVRAVQWVFAGVYLMTQALVMAIYLRASPKRMPPWALVLLCLSKRMHSLYVLRLFNDCWAMLLLYTALLLFTHNRWAIGCVLYSLAVSVKMNIFLFAPGLLFLLIEATGGLGAIYHISICAVVQLVLGAPFLATNPWAYIGRSFGGFGDLNQKWSVNWKFLPSYCFHSSAFVVSLLVLHLLCLVYLASSRWLSHRSRFYEALRTWRWKDATYLPPGHVLTILLTSNFAGIAFSRSLHFQFYTWYWHGVPFLLWRATSIPLWLKLITFFLLEYAWSYGLNRETGTSTVTSSIAIQVAHLVILSSFFLEPRTASLASLNKRT